MAPQLQLHAVAFVSPQNHPILIRSFSHRKQDDLKYQYIAHTSLDVIEERTGSNSKSNECYLGLLYTLQDVAVYGYVTPLKVKIILSLGLTDSVVRDADITMIFRAMHMAYFQSLANPFLRLDAPFDSTTDHTAPLTQGLKRWKGFKRRVDDVGRAVGANVPPDDDETS
ncbi:Sedlin [Fomitiporia mediterranea MF3/22]|uniref:Sedlin n=1 Tax=Fomitiporia mediterranea (strain MF3/22) TaxID=694068 RepID=UPI0004409309|nr:Sedlin [Fomitiporia mediterranea MF3/22]EJD00903.1 Sedlin [Fomitiporia mediterranea MF3/22]